MSSKRNRQIDAINLNIGHDHDVEKIITDCDHRAAKMQNRRHGGSWVEPLPITENWMQVRGVDQTPYPSQLHGASLATAMQQACRPLHEKQLVKEGGKKKKEKFFIYPDVTH